VVGKGEAEAVEAIEEGGFTTEDKDIVEACETEVDVGLSIGFFVNKMIR
jgi:hypothetical protein